jgi:cytidylate kinase
MTHIPVITIDGPSGSGKGAITHRLAEALGFHILDSGALYRLIGLAARRRNIALDAEDALVKLALELEIAFQPTSDPEEPIEILLFGERVTRDLRTNEAGTDASKVAPIEAVREAIKDLQQDFRKAPGLIADGRDMGTVVFIDSDAKIYLTASAETRAERRYKQLKDKGIDVSLHALFISIQERDERDMNREVAPLIPAADARVIDSTKMDIDQVFNEALAFVRERLAN